MSRTGHTIRWYILKEFLRRFIPAIIVLFFIFVLQTFWVYFDELAGKGLSMGTIFKFFYYFSPNILLYSLPLAILIAGLMTYGNLGENNELAAIKAAGMSVNKSMKYLLFFNLLLALLVLFIANTIQPAGNLKFTRLRVAIARKMPAAVIREGRFSKIGPFNIKVEKKYGPKKSKLQDVIIHQEVQGVPDKIITAEKGEFINDENTQILQLRLYNGQYYEDLTRQQRNSKDRKELPALDSRFRTYFINIDMSESNKLQENKGGMRIYHMLNIPDLIHSIDSLDRQLIVHDSSYTAELLSRHHIEQKSSGTKIEKNLYNWMKKSAKITPSQLNSILSRALSKAKVNFNYIKRKRKYRRDKTVFRNKYIHTLNEKFSLPFYIFLLFLIGIPLGAIIRKGGFGLPFVFGLLIYTSFYMLSMLGKSLAEDGTIPPWSGAWLPVLITLPLALWLIANTGRQGEIKMPAWWKKIKAFFARWKPQTHPETDTIIFPESPAQTPDWSVTEYKLKDGILYYRPHEKNFDAFYRFLQNLQKEYKLPYVLAYWKPDDDFRRENQILGEMLMIRVKPDDTEILTNLDIAYTFDNGHWEPVTGLDAAFIPYKNFL